MSDTDEVLGLYIDIEGFSSLFKTNDESAKRFSSNFITHDMIAKNIWKNFIYCMYRVCNEYEKLNGSAGMRCIIYQFGDGIFVETETNNTNVEFPLTIALSVMRLMLCGGIKNSPPFPARPVTCRASIARGDLSDCSGWLPDDFPQEGSNGVDLHYGGKMFLMPVMGSLLVNTARMKGPKGPLLIVSEDLGEYIPKDVKVINGRDSININWISSNMPMANEIIKSISNKPVPDQDEMRGILIKYTEKYKQDLSDEWVCHALRL